MHAEQQYRELKARLVIDILQIDQELIRLPPDTQEVAEYCAQALQLRDACAHALELDKALAGTRMREAEEQIAQNRVQAQIPLDNRVQISQQALDEAKFDVALWQALLKAYEEKGSSLRRICDMMLAGFLTPSSIQADARAQIRAASKSKPKAHAA
jgi:hypothetical protein